MPIPRNMIRKLASSNGVYSEGLNFLTGMCVKDMESTESDFVGIYHISAKVSDGGESFSPSAEIDDAAWSVNSFSCDCEESRQEGACRHVVGMLLSFENRFFNQNISRRTVVSESEQKEKKAHTAALSLINTYALKTVRKTLSEQEREEAVLLPVLDISRAHMPQVSFRLGKTRMYVIRDLAAFYDDMTKGTTKEYGKHFNFLHDEANFNDESKAYLHFFMSNFAAEQKNANVLTEIKHMHLSPRMLDEFVSLFEDRKIQTDDEQLIIANKNPDFQLYLKKSGASYVMRLANSDFKILKGYKRIYIKRDDRLYACDESFTDDCADFLSAISKKEQISVSADDMQAFYNNVLLRISRHINIRSQEELSDFIPKPLVASLYLDTDRTGRITSELKFRYGEEEYNAFDEARSLKTVGNLREELLIKTVLMNYFDAVDSTAMLAYIDRDDERVYTLLSEGLPRLKKYAQIFVTDKFKAIRLRPAPQIGVGVKLNSELLSINILMDGPEKRELSGILESYRQKKKYHRLRDGSFLSLEQGALSEFTALSDGLKITKKDLDNENIEVPLFRALYLDNVLKDSAYLKYERGGDFKEMVMSVRDFKDTNYAVPESLKNVLRNYQKHGYRWLKTLHSYGFCGILADDMGLGKTLEVLTLLLSEKEEKEKVVALVVCPASLVLNWESEANRFAPQLKTLALIGSQEERADKLAHISDYDLVITSYDILKRDQEEYSSLVFDFLIVDEAQYIKNARTQNAKAVKEIRAKNRLALTGTPIENSLAELWSIFDFLMPGFLFSYSHFKKQYEVPIVKEKEETALEDLRKMVAPFILRRLKKDVLKELPEKTETVVYANFDEEQEKIYKANLAEMREELIQSFASGDASKNHFHILAMLTRLRQLSCDPSLVYDNYKGGSAKLAACMELIENSIESGHKMLVFSQFTSMLDILEQELEKRKIPFYLLEGATKQPERLRYVEQFNSDTTPVFLISLKAGGTGLNLTGADVVIHYDPWWNLSATNQASDRAHRIGQKNNVQVFKLIAKDSIEEKIMHLGERKAELADSIIREGDNLLSCMDKDEILKLFE